MKDTDALPDDIRALLEDERTRTVPHASFERLAARLEITLGEDLTSASLGPEHRSPPDAPTPTRGTPDVTPGAPTASATNALSGTTLAGASVSTSLKLGFGFLATFMLGGLAGQQWEASQARVDERVDAPRVESRADEPAAATSVAPTASSAPDTTGVAFHALPTASVAPSLSLPPSSNAGATPSSIATGAVTGLPSANSKADALARERTWIDTARAALARRNLADADAALQGHAREYPSGALREDREALRVQWLLASGRHDEARAALTKFRASYAESLFTPSLERQLIPHAASATTTATTRERTP
jgi:hypothetical protein